MADEIIKTSISINSKLWEEFKVWCIKNKISMSEKLEELLKKTLKSGRLK